MMGEDVVRRMESGREVCWRIPRYNSGFEKWEVEYCA